jgi:hypothetical protein
LCMSVAWAWALCRSKPHFSQAHDIFVSIPPLKRCWIVHRTRMFFSKVQSRHGLPFGTRSVHVCGLDMGSLPLNTPLFPGTFFFRELPTPENLLDCPHHSTFRFKSSNLSWTCLLNSLCACVWPGHDYFATQNPTFCRHMWTTPPDNALEPPPTRLFISQVHTHFKRDVYTRFLRFSGLVMCILPLKNPYFVGKLFYLRAVLVSFVFFSICIHMHVPAYGSIMLFACSFVFSSAFIVPYFKYVV